MLTTPLRSLVASMRPQTALLGMCFSPYRLELAITDTQLKIPSPLAVSDNLTADGLLNLAKHKQVVR